MLRISKLTDYAIVAMTTLAEAPDKTFSAPGLAAATHLEAPTMAKILKLLAKGGLVESFRGAHGGYRLAQPAASVSMADIIRVMEGPIGMTECSVHQGLCAQESVCNVRSNWRRISQAVESALGSVTLAEMGQPASQRDNPLQVRVATQ